MAASFETIVTLDFGGQYTQLIARRIRELGVYSEILPYDTPSAALRRRQPHGIILSGGPSSVYEEGAPHCDRGVIEIGVPVLGICYGLQLISFFLGGRVEPSSRREYGAAKVRVLGESALLNGVPAEFPVWMSHGDQVTAAPPGFSITAATSSALGAVENHAERLYGKYLARTGASFGFLDVVRR